MSEQKRGCGYRKIGGLYLVCDGGIRIACDGLPLELESCMCCGFKPPFTRNLQRLHPQYIMQAENENHTHLVEGTIERYECTCEPECPLCHAKHDGLYGLMYVGKEYTPTSFIHEAEKMGISKRISEVPRWLVLGQSWVYLAHNEVPMVTLDELKDNGLHSKEPERKQAIFYGFRPQRIEMPVWKGELSNEELMLLESRGITPVLLDPTPENRKLHKNAKVNVATLLRKWQQEEED